MALVVHHPWKPTCWVGGWFLPGKNQYSPWIDGKHKELEFLNDDSRQKYAATKATSAILRSMRK